MKKLYHKAIAWIKKNKAWLLAATVVPVVVLVVIRLVGKIFGSFGEFRSAKKIINDEIVRIEIEKVNQLKEIEDARTNALDNNPFRE